MIHSVWLGSIFAVASLIVAGVHVAAGIARRDDIAACSAHAAMSLGMAGMFSPWGDPVPDSVGAVLFAVIGAWFAARYLRRGERADTDAVHLVVGPVAMIVMYLSMDHGPDQVPDADGSGHAAHASAAGGAAPLLAALFLALAAYFVWHAWLTAGRAAGAADRRSPIRIAHVVMSALMAVMLLGSL